MGSSKIEVSMWLIANKCWMSSQFVSVVGNISEKVKKIKLVRAARFGLGKQLIVKKEIGSRKLEIICNKKDFGLEGSRINRKATHWSSR